MCRLRPSRIEWVWLHWSEYLQAREEFEAWLSKHQRHLDMRIELQLGVKEKLWQVDQQRVVVSDVHGQAVLLERLLDEADALHNRTQDPTVKPQALERLQKAYNDVRDRAEVRTRLPEAAQPPTEAGGNGRHRRYVCSRVWPRTN